MIFSGVVDTFCKNGNFCNYESLKVMINATNPPIQWNLSKTTHQWTREMCQIVQDVRHSLI